MTGISMLCFPASPFRILLQVEIPSSFGISISINTRSTTWFFSCSMASSPFFEWMMVWLVWVKKALNTRAFICSSSTSIRVSGLVFLGRCLPIDTFSFFSCCSLILSGSSIVWTGRFRVKQLPLPGVLSTVRLPPKSFDTSRQMARPNPVPPYSLVIEAWAWLNRLKMDSITRGYWKTPTTKNKTKNWFNIPLATYWF